MSKVYCFDLDGTICEERKTFERSMARPNKLIINVVNDLYKSGNTIIIYTARGWGEYNMTVEWLKANKVKYTTLICGKPIYDYWVDDRAVNVKDIDMIKE